MLKFLEGISNFDFHCILDLIRLAQKIIKNKNY